MHTTQYFEELRSITARIDRLLPPPFSERVEENAREGARHPAIEAKPTQVLHLQHKGFPRAFRSDIPPLHQNQASRRALVESKTRYQTSLKDPDTTEQRAKTLPPGVTLWHTTDNARRILLLVRRDLEMLFDSDLEQPFPHDEDAGVFATPGPQGGELCFRDSMALIAKDYPYLHKICWEYADIAAHIYGIKLSEFGVISRVLVHRTRSRDGTPMRLFETRQAKWDGGPILIISVGIPCTAHDFSPTLAHTPTEQASRVVVPEGIMMVIDGDVRFRYSHGLPSNQEGASVFFTITISMDTMGPTSIIGYEELTRTLIMASPMRMEHIITTTPPAQSRCDVHAPLQRDTLWRIVQAMRTRARSAESHLIMKKYKNRD